VATNRGKEHERSATLLAQVYADAGKYAEAEDLYLLLLARKKALGTSKDFSRACWIHGQLGKMFQTKGDLNAAEMHLRSAVKCLERLELGDNFSLAHELTGLASVLLQKFKAKSDKDVGKRLESTVAKAVSLILASRKIPPLFASTASTLADICKETGRPADAQQLTELVNQTGLRHGPVEELIY